MRAISPRRESASFARRIVSSTSAAACVRSCDGSENTSSIVPRSAPIRFSNSITSAFVTSTSPYTWDWNAPESVIMAPENPRNSWRPCRRTDSRCGPLPRMYAFVMRISAWNRLARSAGGMIGRFGFTTGSRAGVVTRRIEDEVERSAEALRSGRHRYFARKLPSREQWRAFDAFRRHVVYLDIETTGFSIGRHAVTVVGVYDGRRKRSYVQGGNLEDLPGALRQAKMLVTFNGSRFDVPFLRKAFPRMGLDLIHMDVLHSLRRLGFVGGLKSIEAEMGISRSDETSGLRGSDAIALWHAYQAGDDDALDLLLTYNLEDAVNLEPLAEFAYEALRSLCLDRGYVTADRSESDGQRVVR